MWPPPPLAGEGWGGGSVRDSVPPRFPSAASIKSINSSPSPIASTRCGERLSTVNGPATRTLEVSAYGLSYRYSYSALAAIDASISRCRSIRAFHHRSCALLALADHLSSASRGIFHSSHFLLSAAFSSARIGS